MFVITLDADWATQELMDYTVDILNSFNIKSTFFLTNKINFSKFKNHELAIHPYFKSDNTYEETLQSCLNFLPTKCSIGSRSHKLFLDMELMKKYNDFGIEYDSNYYISGYDEPKPFLFTKSNILEIPFFFSDDHYTTYPNFDLKNINLENKGVKVFIFHPFHIFMNSRSEDNYIKNKKWYHDFDVLQKNVEKDKPGTLTLFTNLLEHIEKNNIPTSTLKMINKEWRNNRL